MFESVNCVDRVLQLEVVLSARRRSEISSALRPITMAGLLRSVLLHRHVYPSIVSPCLSFLRLLVHDERVNEAFLV